MKLSCSVIPCLRHLALAGLVLHFGAIAGAETPAANSAATTASKSLPENFEDHISELIHQEKFDEADRYIARQEALSPDDPDLAVAKANLNLFRPEVQPRIVLNQFDEGTTQPPANVEKAFQVLDSQTSEPRGYLGQEVPEERAEAVKKSLAILRGAVAKHPDRLDIRLGISQLHAMNEDFEGVLANLEESVKYAAAKDYKGLTKARNKPATDAAQSLNDNLHEYYIQYSRGTENPDDKLAFRYAELTTKYFPKDVRAWNNLCAEYAQRRDYDKAIDALMKAHELDKKDGIVLMNIAHLYAETNKPDKAIEYLQKVVDLKHPDFSEEAAEAIKELKKKPE